VAVVVGFVLAPFVYLFFVRKAAERIERLAERDAQTRLEEAEAQSKSTLREAELAAKEKLLEARSEFEKVAGQERAELEERERRANRAEEDLARRRAEMERLERELESREAAAAKSELRGSALEAELTELVSQERENLEKIAGLTVQGARDELVRLLQDEARMEAAHSVRRLEEEAREKAHRESQRIIATAIERTAADYVAETTVSVVMLPSDDMKGRIIGREGRNIRTLEMATGVDLIVDDTPQAVILSGFDPFRREIARVSLERLIADGRIHPARIESVVAKVKEEFDERVRREGESALLELNLANVHSELVALLGRLRFRTSYGQNVLAHSREVALLAAAMAGELGVDVEVAKRGGLFHDIGKAVDREMEGTHLQIGIDLLRKFGEKETVVHAMACHHGDYEPETVEAVLVTAADALSAARPGARREILENYVKRLEQLEEIASSFKGVQKTFAIQAGREVRIIVDSENLSDEEAMWLSKDVARKVEAELTYPGQIKVTVIRETRSVEIAR
jgi:ribonuclease Y